MDGKIEDKIPKQLRQVGFRFCKLAWKPDEKGICGKIPCETHWQDTKNYAWDDPRLQEWLAAGNNIGVCTGYKMLFVPDIDSQEIYDKVKDKLPKTFMVKSGGRGLPHYYYFLDDVDEVPNRKEGKVDLRGLGGQVVCAGSVLKRPEGSIIGEYTILEDYPIQHISWLKIKEIFEIDTVEKGKQAKEKDTSRSGKEWGELLRLIRRSQKTTEGLDKDSIFKQMELFSKWKDGTESYRELTWQKAMQHLVELSLKKEEEEKAYKVDEGINLFTDNKLELARRFWQVQPFFYDESQLFWLWNHETKSWDIIDEIKLIDMMSRGLNTEGESVKGKFWAETTRALKIIGRRKQPKPLSKEWIQFKNCVVNINTGEEQEPAPEYFLVNPIPWKLNEHSETPTIDRLFDEWVGEDYKKTLYEVIAYCTYTDYPIHTIVALIGKGRNGKSSFLNLVKKFLGLKNVASTKLETLLENRFESAKLYKKLAATISETNDAAISKSGILKELCGQDLIGYEFKNKNPFDDVNYAKILMSTNSLPPTYDDTDGFFRRWLIIDFPKQFPEGKNIVEIIPNTEFEALARKSTIILKDLLIKGMFTNQGTIAERKRKYEERSDPLQLFIEKYCDEVPDAEILSTEFTKKFLDWCKQEGYRTWSDNKIGRSLKNKGYEKERLLLLQSRHWYVLGLKWKVPARDGRDSSDFETQTPIDKQVQKMLESRPSWTQEDIL